jgi:hypothetical protein
MQRSFAALMLGYLNGDAMNMALGAEQYGFSDHSNGVDP